MRLGTMGSSLGLLLCVSFAAAQTPVTTTSSTPGTMPVFTGSSTVGNSPIVVNATDDLSVNGDVTNNGAITSYGSITSIGADDTGGSIHLINLSKSNAGQAQRWSIYNMTDGYGDSLQFWDYDSLGCGTGSMLCAPRLTLMDNGNVGIGTTNPQYSLDVGAGSIGYNYPLDPSNYFANSSLHFNVTGDANLTYLAFQVHGWPGSTVTPLVLTGAGNVGIGTTSPTKKLDVNGDVNVAGSIYTTGIVFPDGSVQGTAWSGSLGTSCSAGGDYAESVNPAGSKASYEPGDVLAISEGAAGDVVKSTEPYSTLVTGIYSTKPGYVGRRQTSGNRDDEIPMAMIGIVPTKVSAENGPIRKGDLLVSASIPGYAMKGTDRSRMLGAVIGKALGNLESGTGVIEVVVTLQ